MDLAFYIEINAVQGYFAQSLKNKYSSQRIYLIHIYSFFLKKIQCKPLLTMQKSQNHRFMYLELEGKLKNTKPPYYD